jgi:hypothetical protein
MRGMPEEQVLHWLREAARVRFERKAEGLRRGAEVHGFSEALFQAVAAGLGYRGNELPFRLLAQRLPVSVLQSAGEWVEGWLFGMAGWVSPWGLEELSVEARWYGRGLWEGWWRHRGEEGRSPLDRELWRLYGQRPLNHPQRRLAALVGLVRVWPRVVRLCRTRDWMGVRRVLLGLRHPFWNWHWTLKSKRMKRPSRLLGAGRVEELLWNVFYPAVGDGSVLERAEGGLSLGNNGRCRIAEERLLVGVEGGRGWLRWPLYQQGLMEWEERVCRRESLNCEGCRFPEWLEARRREEGER